MKSPSSLLAVVFSLSLVASGGPDKKPIADFEPTRIWTGQAYADSIVEHFRRTHKNIPIVIDRNDILDFKNEKDKAYSLKTAWTQAKETFNKTKGQPISTRITTLGRSLLPDSITNLTMALEDGTYIYPTEPAESRNAKETAFAEWIQAQPDHSIEPHVLMSKVLEINNGRLFAAWTMAWNVLSNNWPAAAVRNYGTSVQKMVSLTGERQLWQSAAHVMVLTEKDRTTGESVITKNGQDETIPNQARNVKLAITKRGDEFSYLYHRIGVELLSMATADYFSAIPGNKTIGSLLAKSGAVAEWMKFTDTAGIRPERKKRVINDVIAGTSGTRIYSLFKSGKDTKLKNDKEISAEDYLKTSKFLYGGDYLLDEGRPSIYEGSQVNPKYWDNEETLEELKLRFEYGTRYDSDALDMILMLANGDYELLHKGLVKYMKSGENDPELNSYIKDHLEGVKAKPKIKDIEVDFNLDPELNSIFMKQAWEGYDLNEAKERWQRLLANVLISKGLYTSYKDIQLAKASREGSKRSCLQFYQ
tara:strand:+ start:7659 stop:9254 length:1596 start_codon:yes stop_codon:yes gene_type:complete